MNARVILVILFISVAAVIAKSYEKELGYCSRCMSEHKAALNQAMELTSQINERK